MEEIFPKNNSIIQQTLLNPDFLGDNIQNASVVDLLQTANGNAFQQQSNDRQFLTENDLVGEVQIHHEVTFDFLFLS